MIEDLKKGVVIKTAIEGETVWATVTGFHNDGGIQARVETPLDNKVRQVGDYIRVEQDDVFDLLRMPPCKED